MRDSLEQPVADFVQKDSQHDRAAETGYEKQCIQENGIQRHPQPVFPIEEKLEVLNPTHSLPIFHRIAGNPGRRANAQPWAYTQIRPETQCRAAPASTNTGSATAHAQTTRRTFYVAPKSVPPFLCGLQDSNGAIVAFTAAACLVLIGRIRFSRGRFASVRPVVIGLAGSQSPADLSNSQSSRLSAASAPSARPPCCRGIGSASCRSLFKCGEKWLLV